MWKSPPFSLLLRKRISTWLDVLLGGSLGSPSVKIPSFLAVSWGPSLKGEKRWFMGCVWVWEFLVGIIAHNSTPSLKPSHTTGRQAKNKKRMSDRCHVPSRCSLRARRLPLVLSRAITPGCSDWLCWNELKFVYFLFSNGLNVERQFWIVLFLLAATKRRTDSGRCGPAMAVPWRCHGRLSWPPSFPATTIQLKNHLSLAVRLGMGDYKQLWKRLTGDRCLTALWPSRHYWGPFSWLSSSVDRHTVVVTGNWEGGGRGTVADLGSAGIRQGIMGNGTIYARRQFVPNLTSLNDGTKYCEVDVGPSQSANISQRGHQTCQGGWHSGSCVPLRAGTFGAYLTEEGIN